MLLLAMWANPESVGLYNWGTILFTCIMSLTDGALRQVLLRAVLAKGGRKFLRKYQVVASIGASTFLSLGLLVLWILLPGTQKADVMLLAPIILAPVASVSNAKSLGILQATHHWQALARGQGIAAAASLLAAVPVVIFGSPILGCALGMLLTEVVFAAYCMVVANRISRPRPVSSVQFASSEYRNMAAYSGLGWLQGQSDRLAIGGVAGPAFLGTFSLATALARSLGDTLASSNANVLRAHLGGSTPRSSASAILSRVLGRAVLMATVSSLIVVVLVRLFVDPLLDDSWDQALALVPVLSLCNVPAVLSWSAGVLHLHYETSKRALLAPFIGVAFAIPAAVLAVVDLRYVMWVVVAREVVLCLVSYGLLGRRAPWTVLLFAFGAIIGLAAVYAVMGLL